MIGRCVLLLAAAVALAGAPRQPADELVVSGDEIVPAIVSGAPMRIRFDPHHPRTLATAGAAVRLAASHDGRIGGDAEAIEIAFGIARPVRTLRLARTLMIGSLSLSALGVRTSDFGDAAAIREEDGDPDEIVVTAERRRNTGRDRIALGADLLARCSSIVFDKSARQIRLSCA